MPLRIKDMPDAIPVFPLPGVLLLPHGQLPLNIFEPRFVAMVDDALRGDRLIGIIQPRAEEDQAALYETGCVGRIKSFSEVEAGRYMITLTGLCRFRIAEELPVKDGYRRVRPDWAAFGKDFENEECLNLDREFLKNMLRDYFDHQGLSCDWDAIDGATDSRLITALSMICPFDPQEKQALLEAPCCHTRAEKFMALLKMSLHTGSGCGGCH